MPDDALQAYVDQAGGSEMVGPQPDTERDRTKRINRLGDAAFEHYASPERFQSSPAFGKGDQEAKRYAADAGAHFEQLVKEQEPGDVPNLQQARDRFHTELFQQTQQHNLKAARDLFANADEKTIPFLVRKAAPFNLRDTKLYQNYLEATNRMKAGEATDTDYKDIAAYERMGEQERDRSTAGQIGVGLLGAGKMVGEMAIANKAVGAAGGLVSKVPGFRWLAPAFEGAAVTPGAVTPTSAPGLIGSAGRAAGFLGKTATVAALTPSMVLEKAQENAKERGGQFTDMQNLAPALALGTLQTAIFGSTASAAEFGGASLKDRLLRIGAKTGLGLVEQQAADVLAGATGLQTEFGVLGDLAEGKGGQALKRASMQAIMFGAFSALHSGSPEKPPNAFADAVNELKRKGYSAEGAARVVTGYADKINDAVGRNPALTRDDGKALFNNMPDGPVKDYAMSLAGSLPEVSKFEPKAQPEAEKPAGKPLPEVTPEAVKDIASGLPPDEAAEFLKHSGLAEPEKPRVDSPMTPEQAAAALQAEEAKGPSRNRVEPRTPKNALPPDAEAELLQQINEGPATTEPLTPKPAAPETQEDALKSIWQGQPAETGQEPPAGEIASPERSQPLSAASRLERMRAAQQKIGAQRPLPQPLVEMDTPLGQLPPKPDAVRFAEAGLTPIERLVVSLRKGKNQIPHEEIGQSKEFAALNGRKVSRTRVQQIEKQAFAKLGEEKSADQTAKENIPYAAASLIERGASVLPTEFHGDPEETRRVVFQRSDAHLDAAEAIDKLTTQMLKEVEKNGRLTGERERFYRDETTRIHDRAEKSALPEGSEHSPVPEDGAGGGEAPVRRNGERRLQEGGTPPEAQPPTEGTATPPQGNDQGAPAAAPGGQAGRNQLIGSELMRRKRSVPKEYEQIAVENGLDPESLHGMAREIGQQDKQAVAEFNDVLKQTRDQLPDLEQQSAKPRESSSPNAPTEGPEPWDEGYEAFQKDLQRGAMGEFGALGVNTAALSAKAREVVQYIGHAARYTKEAVGRIAGQHFPTATAIDRATGEAMSDHIGTAVHAKMAAEHYGPLVSGEGATEEFKVKVGGAILENRMRKAKENLLARSQEMLQQWRAANQRSKAATNPADRAKAEAEAIDAAKRAVADRQAASNVTSVVGAADSPFADETAYQAALQDPQVASAMQRYREKYVPEKQKNFMASQGLDTADEIRSITQDPDMPVLALALSTQENPTSSTVFAGGSKEDLLNLKLRRDPSALEAKLSAGAYELNIEKIIEKDLMRSIPIAMQARMYRAAEAAGLGRWAPLGERTEGFTPLPATQAPKNTQNAKFGDVFHVADSIKGEFTSALQLESKKAYQEFLAHVMAVPTQAALASAVEAFSHTVNLGSALFTKPSGAWHGGIGDLLHNLYTRFKDKPAWREKMLRLAEINALKPEGAEGGTFSGLAEKIGKWVNPEKPLPKIVQYLDPTHWGGKVLDEMSNIVRATLGDWADRQVRQGRAVDTVTNKRDFINQSVGNYFKAAQNGLVKWLRDTGIGPFATAATTFTAEGAKSLGLNTNLQATGPKAAVLMRAEVFAKMAAVIGGTMIFNMAKWGRWDGDDETPLMAIKVGEDENGKGKSFDLSPLAHVKRGMRAVGILGYLDGVRQGKETGASVDKGIEGILHSLAHPAMGPGPTFAWTAATGKDGLGRQIAPKVSTATTAAGIHRAAQHDMPELGSSQFWENFKTALANANPVYAALSGAADRGKEVSEGEKEAKLLGPIGFKYREAPAPKRKRISR